MGVIYVRETKQGELQTASANQLRKYGCLVDYRVETDGARKFLIAVKSGRKGSCLIKPVLS